MKISLDIANLSRLYRSGELTPLELVEDLLGRMAGGDSHAVWISRLDADALGAPRARANCRPCNLC